MYRLVISYLKFPLYSGTFDTLEDAVKAQIDNETRGVVCSLVVKVEGKKTWEPVLGSDYLGLKIRLRG